MSVNECVILLNSIMQVVRGQVNLKKLALVSCLNLHYIHAEFNESWSRDVYVVNKCPSGSSNNLTVSQCMLGSEAGSEPFLHLPVFGRRSLVFYLNIYCAACNDETDVNFLRVEHRCSSKVSSKCFLFDDSMLYNW